MELEEIKMAEEKKNPTGEDIDELDDEEDDAGTEGTEDGSSDDGKKGTSGGKASGGKGTAGASGAKEKTFSQAQVTKMMTREKNQGRTAAFNELGIDPKDTKTVNMIKAFIDSQKTDDQKAAEKEAKEQSARAEAEQRAAIAEAKAEAMMLGVKPQYVDDLVTLALAKMSDDSDLKTIIGEFKTKYPVWFGESEEDTDDKGKGKGKTGQKGTGSSVKDSGKDKNGGKEPQGLGARLAAQRKSSGKKSSYWGKKS